MKIAINKGGKKYKNIFIVFPSVIAKASLKESELFFCESKISKV